MLRTTALEMIHSPASIFLVFEPDGQCPNQLFLLVSTDCGDPYPNGFEALHELVDLIRGLPFPRMDGIVVPCYNENQVRQGGLHFTARRIGVVAPLASALCAS